MFPEIEGTGNEFRDEQGGLFRVGNIVTMSFRGGNIPSWYKQTFTYSVLDTDIRYIGKYVTRA